MVGFAVASYKENGVGGLVAQGLGTSMLQISNIIKNPWILLPATLAGAIVGPISTCLLKMTNIPVGAGMGTSGLVGQIGTFTDMGFTLETLWEGAPDPDRAPGSADDPHRSGAPQNGQDQGWRLQAGSFNKPARKAGSQAVPLRRKLRTGFYRFRMYDDIRSAGNP